MNFLIREAKNRILNNEPEVPFEAGVPFNESFSRVLDERLQIVGYKYGQSKQGQIIVEPVYSKNFYKVE